MEELTENKKLSVLGVEDIELAYQLDRTCFKEGIAFPKSFIAYLLTSPDCLALGIKRDKKLLGMVIIRAKSQFSAELVTLDIDSKERRKGLGSLLLSEIEKILKERGFRSIYLQVAFDNQPALKLYQKFGYFYKKTIPNYYPDSKDAFLLEKKL